MKKLLLVSILVSGSVLGLFAQSGSGRSIRFGFKFSPTVSYARVVDKDDNDNVDFKHSGATMRMIIGPYIDFGLTENVTFSSGIWFSPRSAIFSAKNKKDIAGGTSTSTSQYNLQYLMVPLYFKFYTNEITSGMKIYFTLGGTFDVKLVEKKKGDDNVGLLAYAKEEGRPLFNYIDASALLGAGVEYNLKDIVTVFGGFSYNRGLVNAINPLLEMGGNKIYKNIAIKNNLIGLDLGVKF